MINLLGVKQIGIGVNEMDCDTADYMMDRYDENMLTGASQADVANERETLIKKCTTRRERYLFYLYMKKSSCDIIFTF